MSAGPSASSSASPQDPSLHPLSPSLHHTPRRSSSFNSLPSGPPVPSPIKHNATGYFDIPKSSTRRHHAASISTATLSHEDLLGLGSARRRTPRVRPSPATYDHAIMEQALEVPSRHISHLDSLTKEEAAIVEMRFDTMADDELDIYVKTLFPILDVSGTPSDVELSPTTPRASRSLVKEALSGNQSPLFPPSPPSAGPAIKRDHPLRILSRAIWELRETVELLESENERLRDQILQLAPTIQRNKETDVASIHESISEALSTSLTSPQVIPTPSSQPIGQGATIRPASLPAPSAHSSPLPWPIDGDGVRPVSAVAGSDRDRIEPPDITLRKRDNRSSWTSGLWVWNKAKPRTRKGSFSSISSGNALSVSQAIAESAIEDGDDVERWRKGDGGSTPAFRAIFLATRIITPDPSSILTSSTIPANGLIAYLAHTLVSQARDDGIFPRDPPGRRTSRGRSRATSIASQELSRTESHADSPNPKGYGDQALAVGRSLFSSVSNATLRNTKSTGGENASRPSLLSRVSSSRPFPTTAVSPPSIDRMSGSTDASPTGEYTPPPSVELAAIVAEENRPPTVLLSRQNLGSFFQSNQINKAKLVTASRFRNSEPPLTDRYGFIYDVQHASLLKDASAAGAPAPASMIGTIPDSSQNQGWIEKRRKSLQDGRDKDGLDRSSSSRRSFDSARSALSESGHSSPRASTPDGIRKSSSRPVTSDVSRHRSPSDLMNPNPSPAKPVIGRDQLTVSARGASSLVPEITAASSTDSSALAKPSTAVNTGPASRATVSSLLEQLTGIHDQQQADRKARWDAFLRKHDKHQAEGNGRKGAKDNNWGAGLIGVSQMGTSGKTGLEEFKQFAKLVRAGIPLSYRGDIWAECCGAKDLLVPGEYKEILRKHEGENCAVARDIQKDVSRTFPGNVYFGGDGPGVAKLERVLTAYAWHNPIIGYCQGMNMLTATLLLIHSDEEQAYWTLLAIIERILPADFYSPTLLASRADQQVLSELVAQFIPQLHDHLESLGIDLASITFGWFLSLFTDCLPVETLLRVWDVFFAEGRDVLFRVAIAILKLHEATILACNNVADLFTCISSMTSRLWTADKLIALQHSYKPIIKHQDINAKFEKHIRILQALSD